jgi:flagellar hook-associated protein 1 FlgK
MAGAFFGLDLALRALHAQQLGLDVTNHNVANANTRGFSRQEVVLQTTDPYTLPGLNRAQIAGQLGTGVVGIGIKRARDVFADVQYRAELGGQQRAQAQSDALDEVESVLNEPSTTGLSSLLNKFFGAWQDVVNDPNDVATRSALVEQASALAASFNRAAQQLGTIQTNLNSKVQMDADQINQISDQLATLNRQIVQVEVLGQRANDFRDRRDLLLDQLSEIVPVVAVEQTDGSMTVTLGGHALVTGQTVDPVTTTATGPGGMADVRFTSDNAVANVTGGELRGLMDARDTNVPGYLAQLNTMATNLMNAVNGLHSAGYGLDGVRGRAFFTGTNASNIAVNATIVADPRQVAAANAAGQTGNSANALAIAQLRQTMNPTPESAYNAIISTLGVDAQAAKGVLANQTILVQMLERRRETVSGVSLDEESVQVIRFQRAYEAAARLITANDQMLDKLINSTGVVGR